MRFVRGPDSGRTSAELLPRFETITYRELWDRAGAFARRIQDLYASDAQPARMRRSPRRSSCPGLPLPQIVRTAMEGYLDIVGGSYLRASQVRRARR